MTSIQRLFLVDECLPQLLIRAYILPHLSVTEQPVLLRHYRDKFGPRSRWKDPDFVPELARDGRWVVLSGDLENQGSRLDSLRIACRRHGLTLILASAKLRELGIEFYGPQFVVQWSNIMAAAEGPKGGQYQIRLTSQRLSTAFEPLECPSGFEAQGTLCVPTGYVAKHDGEPQSLSRNATRKRKRLATMESPQPDRR